MANAITQKNKETSVKHRSEANTGNLSFKGIKIEQLFAAGQKLINTIKCKCNNCNFHISEKQYCKL